MTAVTVRGVLDTSVIVAIESGRPARLDLLPPKPCLTLFTLAELQAGALAASDLSVRALRLETVSMVAKYDLLLPGERCSLAWASLRVALNDAGRSMKVNDLWIAAVACAHGLPVATQDDDFDVLAELGLLEVIKI